MSYVLTPAQDAIVAHLAGCSALAAHGLEVLSRKVGDIETKIAEQLSTIGQSIFVSEVEMGGVSGDLPNVSADDAQFTVALYVDPTTANRDMGELREIVMRRLHGWTPGVDGAGVVTLLPDPEHGRPKKSTNIRDISFRLSLTMEAGID